VCTGQKKNCDDGDACTDDACDESGACVHSSSADGTACDDLDGCTTTSSCLGGVCTGGDRVCEITLPPGGGPIVIKPKSTIKVQCSGDPGSTCEGQLIEVTSRSLCPA
jgi:hypothetical protein